MQPFPSISIIGTGNVAELFGNRLIDAGITISSISGRNQERLQELSSRWKCTINSLDKIQGDIVLVAVSDDVTKAIIEQLNPNQIVLYTAGTIHITSITHPLLGVFYPLQTISKNRISKLGNFPILVEYLQPEVEKIVLLLAHALSTKVTFCSSTERNKIHCIAVFINNFSNHLIHLGQKIAKSEQIEFELFSGLIQETFEKLTEMNAHDAQTGPARRNDLKTIYNHLNVLQEPEKSTYKNITNSILSTYNHDQL